jgi:hypothetical protein
MHRDRFALIALSLGMALGVAVSCTDSEPVNTGNFTGRAGTSGSSTPGTAGTSSNVTGSSGTTGTAGTGTNNGTSGTTGTAGTGTNIGASGTTGTAGTGTTVTGTSGTNGAAGAAGTTGMGGAGGAGGAGGTSGAVISFATDIYPFIQTQCMPCHITQTSGNLSMKDATTAYANLVTNGAAKTNLTCKLLDATKKRVVVGDPTHSFMYIKVSQTDAQLQPQGCQPAMPEVASKLTLTTAQTQMIHDWIMGGANP